ncbi:hypothetical protein BA059_20840 [Mycolicibacterium sp. (ex Dasyatis americana)]|nr:hypothetical protein BA059_20840 [Mycolicibacterium sp. (ex Dasyatis americana)]
MVSAIPRRKAQNRSDLLCIASGHWFGDTIFRSTPPMPASEWYALDIKSLAKRATQKPPF